MNVVLELCIGLPVHQDRNIVYITFGAYFMVCLRVLVAAPVGLNVVLELCIGKPGAPGPCTPFSLLSGCGCVFNGI